MKTRVLIIDDEPSWQDQLRDIIKSMYLESDVVDNIQNAKEALKNNTYNLVLLDIFLNSRQMSLESQQFCEFLSLAYPKITIIIVTGKPLSNGEAFEFGKLAFRYVEKSTLQLSLFKTMIQSSLGSTNETKETLNESRNITNYVNTGGGAYIAGDVSTGGSFTGRDKTDGSTIE